MQIQPPPANGVDVAVVFDLTACPEFARWEFEERMRQWSVADFLRDHVDGDVLTERDRGKVLPRLGQAKLNTVRALLEIDSEDLDSVLEDKPVCMRARVHRRHVCRALMEVRCGRVEPPMLEVAGEGGADGGEDRGDERRDLLRIDFQAPLAPVARGVFVEKTVGKPERPEAHLLCWFILMHPDFFLGGKHLLELGAGWGGTAGLAAAALMHKRGDADGQVLLTDTFDGHLEEGAEQFLRATVARARTDRGHPVRMQRLNWDSESDRTDALRVLGGRVDHVLGSDILNYTLHQPRRPLIAAKDLMERSGCARADVSFWCVYHNRLGSAHMDGVRSAARDLDLKLTEIAPRTFIPQRPFPPPLNMFARGDLVLLRFQLYFPN